jgi:hypothetical protein
MIIIHDIGSNRLKHINILQLVYEKFKFIPKLKQDLKTVLSIVMYLSVRDKQILLPTY